MTRETYATRTPRERFVLCGVLFPEQVVEQEGELSEAHGLVVAAGGEVVGPRHREDQGEHEGQPR